MHYLLSSSPVVALSCAMPWTFDPVSFCTRAGALLSVVRYVWVFHHLLVDLELSGLHLVTGVFTLFGIVNRMPDEAPSTFTTYMHKLWMARGYPASREVAAQSRISYVSIVKVLRHGHVPKWETAEPIVVALGGDVTQARGLWLETRKPPALRQISEPPSLVLPFAQVLGDWVDHDVALFALGRALGLIEGAGFDVFQAHKHVFWSEGDDVGEMLIDVLDRLVGATLVERQGDRYRLKPGLCPG